MFSKTRKTMASSIKGHEDRISELPTPLLCSIISLLPAKEAVATSLVSRRWRYLRLYLTRLDLDGSCSRSCTEFVSENRVRRSIHQHVEEVLYSQRNNFISSCRIVLSKDGVRRPSDEEKNWIDFLKNQKALENLEIICGGKDFIPVWPSGFYNGRNLRVVELVHELTWILDASPFEGCANLETLKLISVKLRDKTLVNIINNCTNLENLVLIRCEGLINVGFQDERLKHLEIDNLHLESFNLHSESLRILSLSNFWSSSNEIRCPNLNVFRSNHNRAEILARFSGLVGCKDRINLNLCSVRVLHSSLDLENWYDLIALRFILRAWINLQQLYITIDKGYDEEYDHLNLSYCEVLFWVGELTDVKMVQIRGFRGREKEMALVSHLIKNAESLEKLVIQFDSPCHKSFEDAKHELLSLSRASTNISIVFNV